MSHEMIDLKNQLDQILEFIVDKEDVILVDYPLHYNVGDLLIFLGELQYLEQKKIKLKHCLSTFNSDISFLKKNITSKTTILCHGGGNFGDLYPIHQNLREKIVENFPNNRIIILPQTAYFDDERQQEKSRDIFNHHNNVVMFARDENTLSIFKDFSDQSYLMPDMAHALYGTLLKSAEQKNCKLYFLRKDIEKIEIPSSVEIQAKNADCLDWEDLINSDDYKYLYYLNRMIQMNQKYINSKVVNKIIAKLWIRKCTQLTNKFSQLFSSYECVITSRLHGHILSCLLDVPSVILDNSYGKNSNYYHLWTQKLPIAELSREES